jgi:hypothetical protein
MSFKSRAKRRATALAVALGVSLCLAAGRAARPRFLPDDPVQVDDDKALDASSAKERELPEYYDFLVNTFGPPGDRTDLHAVNVNTVDEVPDSTWFTNRLGRRPMTVDEVVRGPDQADLNLGDGWMITRGKSSGFQPGFQAVNIENPDAGTFQVEFDPPGHPEMATSAELIGTALYHAMGYNVVDVYIVEVDPAKLEISEKATIKYPGGRRPFDRGDLRNVLLDSARRPNGRYRALASRFAPGQDMGPFRYHGTRADDPNDIYPHEHRRELRGNRVFAAWLNHDDSRAINSLDMRVEQNGKKHFKHYMFDFGSILGSATRFEDNPQSGHEYLLEKRPSLLTLVTFGLYVRPWLFIDVPHDIPKAAGKFHAEKFEPEEWRAEYPNTAFMNMRPDDAFWGARIVAAFTDEMIRAVAAKPRFSDPAAAQYLADTLIKRRDAIERVWLNQVNPIVDLKLGADGVLTFRNAAVDAGAATPARSYTVAWSKFDNNAGTHSTVGTESEITEPRGQAPAELLSGSEYVAVTIRGNHPDQKAWAKPTVVYFRRSPAGWDTVGIERQ